MVPATNAGLTVAVNLLGVPAGAYDVRVTLPTGTTRTLTAAFQVIAAGEANLETQLNASVAQMERRGLVALEPGADARHRIVALTAAGQALLPAGRDLLVLHAQVNTGLDHPVAGGGYGGSVSQPVNLVAK